MKKLELIIPIICCILSFGIWKFLNNNVILVDEQRAQNVAQKIVTDLAVRLASYDKALMSLGGLYGASEDVSRAEFKSFIYSAGLDRDFQAIKSYVFVRVVAKQDVPAFRRELADVISASGNTLKISPDDTEWAEENYLVDYVVTPHGEDFWLYGASLKNSPEILPTLERARETKVISASEVKDGKFYMALPVFSHDYVRATQTNERLIGFAVIVLDYKEISRVVTNQVIDPDIRMQVVNGEGKIMFDTLPGTQEKGRSISNSNLVVGGKEWKISFTLMPRIIHKDYVHRAPWYFLIASLLTSWLIYAVIIGLRREAVNSLKIAKGEATLASSIESFPRGFVIVDTQGQIILCNKVLSKILDSKENEWTLKKIDAKLSMGGQLSTVYHQALEAGQTYDPPEFLQGKLWLKLYMAPVFIKGPGSEVIGVIMTIDDISDAKALERSRDEFFSIASHELRTPLTAIRGNAEMIVDIYADKVKEPDFRDMLRDITESSTRLIEIVNDFLSIGQLEQGKIQFKSEPINLGELIKVALKECQTIVGDRKISLEWIQPKEELPIVRADRDRTRQVLVNLIGNGVKFTESGSVKIRAEVNEQQVVVYVQDTGRGIPMANQSLLFRKFQQAGSSLLTRDTSKGTGLGLYISKMIVEGMGGTIWLEESKPNQGSTFAFTLPIERRS